MITRVDVRHDLFIRESFRPLHLQISPIRYAIRLSRRPSNLKIPSRDGAGLLFFQFELALDEVPSPREAKATYPRRRPNGLGGNAGNRYLAYYIELTSGLIVVYSQRFSNGPTFALSGQFCEGVLSPALRSRDRAAVARKVSWPSYC